jgi:hypothetical protein
VSRLILAALANLYVTASCKDDLLVGTEGISLADEDTGITSFPFWDLWCRAWGIGIVSIRIRPIPEEMSGRRIIQPSFA